MENDVIDLGWPGCAGKAGGLGGGDLMLRHFVSHLEELKIRPLSNVTDVAVALT